MRDMKNSGIEWIGDIPKSWRTLKNKYIGEYINGYAFKPSDWSNSGKPIIRIQDLTGTSENPNYYNGDLGDKYVVKNGDVLISWAATLDAYVWSGCTAWLNQHIFKAIPNEDNVNKYYFIWLMKVAMENMNNDNKHGIMMQHVTADVFDNYCLPVPPIEEQKAIAEYLDKKCADIDEIISAKEKTNELLKERRQSIITEAVTKGLNPNAEMKDSGVDWIGEISFSKNVVRLKHYLENQMQYGANESGTSDANGNIRYIRITDINNDSSLKDNEDNKYLTIEQAESYILKDGDVLFARSGATVGKSFIYKESYGKCAFAGYLIKAECNRTKLLPKYLFYYTSTSTYESWKNMIFIQATIQNIGADKYQEMPLIMTSIEEQKEIVDYLDKKCEEIDKLIESNNKTIEKLQEYRKSLIYEAVTGKIEIN